MGKKPPRRPTSSAAAMATTSTGRPTTARWLLLKRSRKTGANQAVSGTSVWRLANGRRAVPTTSQSHGQWPDARAPGARLHPLLSLRPCACAEMSLLSASMTVPPRCLVTHPRDQQHLDADVPQLGEQCPKLGLVPDGALDDRACWCRVDPDVLEPVSRRG